MDKGVQDKCFRQQPLTLCIEALFNKVYGKDLVTIGGHIAPSLPFRCDLEVSEPELGLDRQMKKAIFGVGRDEYYLFITYDEYMLYKSKYWWLGEDANV